MDFFIDFEAYQPSGRILSIGCTSGTGNFYALCKSPQDTVSEFIQNLTGITQEKVDNSGKDYNTAFREFLIFIDAMQQFNESTPPKFFVYGKEDANFIKHTMKYLTDARAYAGAAMILAGLVDLSIPVRQHLMTNGISLRNVLKLVRQEEVVQNHNALGDALMLKELAENFESLEPIGDKVVKTKMTEFPTANSNNDKYAHLRDVNRYFSDNSFNMNTAPIGDENNWYLSWQYQGKKWYFCDVETFVIWYVRFILKLSAKRMTVMKDIMNNIQNRSESSPNPKWKKRNIIINPYVKENVTNV